LFVVFCCVTFSEAYGENLESNDSMAAAVALQSMAPAEHVLYHYSA